MVIQVLLAEVFTFSFLIYISVLFFNFYLLSMSVLTVSRCERRSQIDPRIITTKKNYLKFIWIQNPVGTDVLTISASTASKLFHNDICILLSSFSRSIFPQILDQVQKRYCRL